MLKPAHKAGALAAISACLTPVLAATPEAVPGPALAAGSVVQVVLGLAFVIALVVAAAWLLKRFSSFGGQTSGLIRIIGAAAVGQRERVLVVEVGSTWLLIGVAPGQVRALHTMPRNESAITGDASVTGPAPEDAGFATRLRRMTERRRHE